MPIGSIILVIQFFFAVVIGLYFWNLLKSQQGNKIAVQRESRKELEKLERLRHIRLAEPLSEKIRPKDFEDIVGQTDGIKALRAALCGPNPQHVIIYGPPGVGKTAAARLVLEEAKKNPHSPFAADAKFTEIDATTARFDERGIADPLIGSVHDPIYQGAGPLGMAGIPQPKPGAVTKAHGGILFIDEIGELHPIQMNKLLKVLEDRKVFLESAYYNAEDQNIPKHIKDIFENGLPADFRLVGATTRSPHEIPPAIRSRCLEVYFRPLQPDEIARIARRAAEKMQLPIRDDAVDVITRYASNGREAVNMVQIAAGIAQTEKLGEIRREEIEWVVSSGQYVPRPDRKVPAKPRVGYVNGLAVSGPNLGMLIEIEARAKFVGRSRGGLTVTGVIDEEEIGSHAHRLKRKSMARGSVENVLTVLDGWIDDDLRDYQVHVNFPGGTPIDGPSAGIAIATAVYSAIKNKPVDNRLAMTGEISLHGDVKPVGGIIAKVEAARIAGAKKVIIPAENYQKLFDHMTDITIMPVKSLDEVLSIALESELTDKESKASKPNIDFIPAAAASNVAGVSVIEQ